MNLSRVIKQLADQITIEERFLYQATTGNKQKPCGPDCEQCAARRELVQQLQDSVAVLRREAT